MSNQTFKINPTNNINSNFNTRTAANNTNNLYTVNNKNIANRHLTASGTHPNSTTNRAQANQNPHLKKFNQQSHSDSSNSFIRQEIMVK